MNLQNYSNEQLELRMKKLVQTERKITHLVLKCIAEMDRRKLYLEKAYSSLFEMLVKDFGYSPSAAGRRVDGARLLRQIPEMAEKIEKGLVNLSQASLIQRAERELRRETRQPVPIETKRELLAQIENQTQAKTEQLIAQTLNIEVNPKNKITQHKDESVTMTITLTREQMLLLEQAQAMLSHAVPSKNWGSLFSYLAKKEISRRTPKDVSSQKNIVSNCSYQFSTMIEPRKPMNNALKEVSRTATATGIAAQKYRKPIPLPIRKQLLDPNASCTYQDLRTGKVCGSQHFLQIDHIRSVSKGGDNSPGNLQVLCGQHNRYKYLLETSM